jgi:hypothetical protein
MRSIQVLGKRVTGWQVLPVDAPDFESAALPRNSFSSAWARTLFFFLPYASALIPHGTASALRSSLSIEFDEVEAEFPGLSSKTNLLAMLTATLERFEDRCIEFLTCGHHVINDPCQFVGRGG